MKSTARTNCPDCAVLPGQLHQRGCDQEVCPYCGHQLLSCFCDGVLDWEAVVSDDDRLPWTGTFPGVAECQEFGWFAKCEPIGWQSCSADDPAAIPDLNRLYMEAVWDREQKRWVKK